MNEPRTVGWIGVGAMGLPMCRNLAKGGLDVVVHDIAPERVRLAAEAGLRTAASLPELARQSAMVFSMVYDDAALLAVVSEDGVLATLARGALLVDMSTVSPAASAEAASRLAARGIRYLRAPVSGSVGVAESRGLAVFASGERDDFDASLPVLGHLSASQHFVGPGEAARVVKLVINMMVVNMTALIGEALRFGEHAGVPRDTLIDSINSSIVGTRHSQGRAESFKTRRYTGAGPMRLAAKDVDLVLAMARDNQVGLPLTALVREYTAQLIHEGRGDTEVTVLAEFPRPASSS